MILKLTTLTLTLAAPSVMAKPLFVLNSNSNHWDPSTKIILANCHQRAATTAEDVVKGKAEDKAVGDHYGERILLLKPRTPWVPGTEIQSLVLVEKPRPKYPSQAFKEFAEFQEQHKKRRTMVYAIASSPPGSYGTLYQFDAHSGEELGRVFLDTSVNTAVMNVEDLYYDHHWHTVLMVVIDFNLIRVYDITDNAVLAFDYASFVDSKLADYSTLTGSKSADYSKLVDYPNTDHSLKTSDSPKPATSLPAPLPRIPTLPPLFSEAILNISKIQPELHTPTLNQYWSDPKAINIGSEWALGCAGSLNGFGVIGFFLLNAPHSVLCLETKLKSKLLHWYPVDSQVRGRVDKIYAVDEEGNLWYWEVTPHGFSKATKLLDKKAKTIQPALKVVPPLKGQGDEIIFLAQGEGERYRGEFGKEVSEGPDQQVSKRLSKSLSEAFFIDQSKHLIHPIVGNFFDVFLRYGRIILLPALSENPPVVLLRNPQGLQPLKVHWGSLSLNSTSNQSTIKSIILDEATSIDQSRLMDKTTQDKTRVMRSTIVQSVLAWDPIYKKEVIITLDTHCNLNLLQSDFNADKYGRASWMLRTE